ncbi:MAG: M23 family metallopeptidase, partial [Rhodocyclaceae bacterium]|nr:M23 family metallopeptidase [Rhodocyclaceae bacterium]
MASTPPIFSQIVQGNKVGRGPVLGSNGMPVAGSHRGVDLAVAEGTPVHPVATGTVVFSGTRADYGNVVVVRSDFPNGESVYSLYGHLKEIDSSIKKGTIVQPGDDLGLSGHTGTVSGTTGNHVHFEMVQPTPGQPIDEPGTLSNYFSYQLLDPKANPYGLLTWDSSRIDRSQLTTTERIAQIKLSDAEFESYKIQLASIETKGKSLEEGYQTVSGTHLGRYQMGTDALVEAGYQDKAGNWTNYAKSQGVSTRQDFLDNPQAQDDALRRFTDKDVAYLVSKNLDLHIGEQIDSNTITAAGLLAGAHNSLPNLKLYVESGGEINRGDSNDFAVSNFVALGSKVQSDAAPISDNVYHFVPPLNAPYVSTYLRDGTALRNSDNSTTYQGIALEDAADGSFRKGDWVANTFDEDSKATNVSILHNDTRKFESTTYSTDGKTATTSVWDKSGTLIHQNTFDRTTGAPIGDFVFNGKQYHADGTPFAAEGTAVTASPVDPEQVKPQATEPPAEDEIAATLQETGAGTQTD